MRSIKEIKADYGLSRRLGQKLCNGCYGLLLSIYEIKAGSASDEERIDQISGILQQIVDANLVKIEEKFLLTRENRLEKLTPEALRFLATSETLSERLGQDPDLEWSPAVIGLCKAVEIEIVKRIMVPLAGRSAGISLNDDKKDKDIGRIARFCANPEGKPPEIGAFGHFLQTVIYSQARREISPLISAFLGLLAQWPGSTWMLEPSGLHSSLNTLTSKFRNRTAHIDEMDRSEYEACRDLVSGEKGLVWRLILSTELPKKNRS